jgi:hypothetical protein
LKTFEKTEKINIAEKHLFKFLIEVKRHYDFSDTQILILLEKSLKKMQKNKKNIDKINILNKLFPKMFKK